jgi:hypothetical protein
MLEVIENKGRQNEGDRESKNDGWLWRRRVGSVTTYDSTLFTVCKIENEWYRNGYSNGSALCD